MSRLVWLALMPVFFLGMLASCRTGKKPVRKHVVVADSVSAPAHEGLPGDVPAPELSAEKRELIDLLLPLKERQIAFATFSGKAKMRYEGGGDKQEFVAGIRIQKDSAVWVSVSALGGLVQVARVLITPDSIRLINYLQREVMALPASEARKLLPVDIDFETIQNLLIGNLARKDGTPTDATDFGGTWSLQLEDRQFVQQVAYNKSDSTMRSSQVRAQQGLPQTALVIQYGNYEPVSGQRFPLTRALNIMSDGGQYYLDMHYSGVAINEPVDFPFVMPKKYSQKVFGSE